MTQTPEEAGSQPPYSSEPPGPPVQPMTPGKRRPSTWWFVPGVLGLVAAAVAVGLMIAQLVSLFDTDATFTSPGRSHTLNLDTNERMLFAPKDAQPPNCRVAQGGDGPFEPVETVSSDDTLGLDNEEWQPFARFTVDNGTVVVRCSSEQTIPVRLGAPIDGRAFVTIGLAFVSAMVLGLAGLIWLVVVLVLYVTRRPRQGVIGG